jgi:hypothetical protein
MKRCAPWFLLLVLVLVVVLAGTAVAAPASMMKGSIKSPATAVSGDRFVFKFDASGTLHAGTGSIYWKAPTMSPGLFYYYEFDVVGFYKHPGHANEAACVGVLRATNHDAWPVNDTVLALWVRDGGAGETDSLAWRIDQLSDYEDVWLTDWQVMTDYGYADVELTREVSSGNILVK